MTQMHLINANLVIQLVLLVKTLLITANTMMDAHLIIISITLHKIVLHNAQTVSMNIKIHPKDSASLVMMDVLYVMVQLNKNALNVVKMVLQEISITNKLTKINALLTVLMGIMKWIPTFLVLLAIKAVN